MRGEENKDVDTSRVYANPKLKNYKYIEPSI
jgi:hypothetical protein